MIFIMLIYYFFFSMISFFFFKQKTAYDMLRSLVGSEMCIRDSEYPICLNIRPTESAAVLGDAPFRRFFEYNRKATWRTPMHLPDVSRVDVSSSSLSSSSTSIVGTMTQRLAAVSYTHLTLPTKRIV
eukprot:TRINITY_DN23189_c0_g2_i1.p1 TRINITY_DN23189_c0_g2~~TRINITY_DN23189_c0_g2_i1.p1  ORF type:complete len:127 (-),score=28.82 TRINITY_DN23189_c0_g2_i1:114-494(-)